MDIDSILERIKPHWIPVCLGLLGILFLMYGFFSFSGAKNEANDLSFKADPASTAGFSAEKPIPTPEKRLAVDVSGAVENPGVYDMPPNARVKRCPC